MELTLKEIAKIVEGKIEGNENIIIKSAAGLSDAGENDISFLSDQRYLGELNKTKASAVIVPEEVTITNKNLIKVKNPYFAFVKILKLINEEEKNHPQGIHSTAIIDKNVTLGKDVSIGAYTLIEEKTEIGEGTIIYSHCYIGRQTKIGKNCLIYSRVFIREKSIIGNRVIIHPGVVIGSDGFGFLPHASPADHRRGGHPQTLTHEKIPQIGIIEIGDDVEIGANSALDRATVGKTKIGSGTKIDNLVHIAHSVEIGKNCLIAAQVAIAGSTKIGNNVVFGGQAGVTDHVSIGEGVRVAGQAGVIGNLPAGVTVSGFPAREHRKMLKIYALIDKLPEIYRLYKRLKHRALKK